MKEKHRIYYPSNVLLLFDVFKLRGKELYLVGGSVRDMLLDEKPKDFDFATNALPEEVMSYFDNVIPTGIDYGTVTVILEDEGYEITTYRKDHDGDGRRPKAVSFSDTIEEDLSRRDFTINSMAMDVSGNIIDLFGGMEDLKKGVVKFVGNAMDRVNEDKLRLIRGIRFATTYKFRIDYSDYKQVYMKASEFDFAKISCERFQMELNKILISSSPDEGIRLLAETKILDFFIPEMRAMIGFNQHNTHHYADVFGHTMDVLKNTPAILSLRLSALFHDVGKPQTFEIGDDNIGHFYQHETVSSDMVEEILKRLKYEASITKKVSLYIKNHMRKAIPKKKASIRKLIRDIGTENIIEFIDFLYADEASTNNPPGLKYDDFKEVIIELLNENPVLTRSGLEINGNDVMNYLGVTGREIGGVLTHLTEFILENPESNNKEALITKGRAYLESL